VQSTALYGVLESSKKPKPSNLNQLARAIVDEATDEFARTDQPSDKTCHQKNPAAVALGKLGGKKGDQARAKMLSERRRKEIAREGARARWGVRSD
jgi:hypothetical protein